MQFLLTTDLSYSKSYIKKIYISFDASCVSFSYGNKTSKYSTNNIRLIAIQIVGHSD